MEIRGVAREPGHRSKIAVWSNEPAVDPVGACVGPKGSRVRNVVTELRGEKIDVVPWSDEPRASSSRTRYSLRRSRGAIDPTPDRAGDRARTTSCRSRSGKKDRTPGSPPGSPVGGSTSSRSPRRTAVPEAPAGALSRLRRGTSRWHVALAAAAAPDRAAADRPIDRRVGRADPVGAAPGQCGRYVHPTRVDRGAVAGAWVARAPPDSGVGAGGST